MIRLIFQHTKGKALFCFFAAPLVMLIEVFSDLQQPTLMAKIVDNGVAKGDGHYILVTGLVMVGFAIFGAIGGVGCGVLANYAALQMGGKLRVHLMGKIMTLSATNIDQLETSSLITRITNDVNQMQTLVTTLTRGLVRAPFLSIGGIIMAFIVSPKLAWILIIVIPILILFMAIVIAKSIPLFTIMQQKIDGINRVMRESLLGIRTIKALTLEKHQNAQFKETNEALQKSSVAAQHTTILLSPVVSLFMNLSIVAVLWLGGRLSMNHAIENGQIIAFVNYMIQITNALVNTINTVTTLSRAKSSADRVIEVLTTTPAIQQAKKVPLIPNNDIQFENVDFRYNNQEYALKNINFIVPAGKKLGIIGSTGSGKTTVLSLLARLYEPTSGDITLGGVNIKEIPAETLHQKLAISLQDSTLFSGTVAENLRYGKVNASDEEVKKAEDIADATEFLNRMPDGENSWVEQRGKNFSGGQKQRLNIARALVANPDILILDDTLSAVDLATDARIQRSLHTLKNKTIIMVAQRVASIMDSDQILVMDEGKIQAAGTHQELLKKSKLYQTIAVSQLGEEVLDFAK